jgi:hypothetical protein
VLSELTSKSRGTACLVEEADPKDLMSLKQRWTLQKTHPVHRRELAAVAAIQSSALCRKSSMGRAASGIDSPEIAKGLLQKRKPVSDTFLSGRSRAAACSWLLIRKCLIVKFCELHPPLQYGAPLKSRVGQLAD